MLWRRTAHTPLIPTTGPVPDTEALRRMLLQASWQRGLWVARRRVAVRWVLWSLRRYGLYLLLTAAAALYVYSSPDALSFLSPLKPPAPLKPAVQGLEPGMSSAVPPTFSPEGTVLPDTLSDDAALPLRLESTWPNRAATNTPQSPQPSQAEDDTELSTPQLKPENWLHSKEP